ncbi:hypothetical protein ACI8B_50378 [Acinetobacter proteolyticus]|uniref:Uncharacterized protein n=1 Tax=Acinetobacter proteolyticus TaxID=1776741 RepID=A0A653KA76_9GAMM|nr:hypothetical protein ACI8B_50378 [Acinetobacter proteolyticus]
MILKELFRQLFFIACYFILIKKATLYIGEWRSVNRTILYAYYECENTT